MTTLDQAAAIYQNAVEVQFETHKIRHSLFREFSFGLQNLIRNLNEEIESDEWRKFVRRLKRWRGEQLAAPLGFDNPAILPAEDLATLTENLSRLQSRSSEFAAQAADLLEKLENLRAQNDNPMLTRIAEIADRSKSLAVVVLESRLIAPTERILNQIFEVPNLVSEEKRFVCRQVQVINEAQLRGDKCFDQIVCCGASRWYSDYVFDAPRARRIHLLQFDWLRENKREPAASFVKPLVARDARETAKRRVFEQTAIESNYLESSDIVPTINLQTIAARFANRAAQNADDAAKNQTIEARLFRLENRRGVFLEEAARVLVLDLEDERKVRKVAVADVAPGMFVLLRDGRGGDLIKSLADKIMGKRAAKRRQFQAQWKENLRAFVRHHGARRIVKELKSLGAIHANETNLRNWQSPNNIETRDSADFLAIMRLCGYDAALEDCLFVAKTIRQAHQKAGKHIRDLLLKQVAETDLTELEKLGEMRFEIAKSSRLIAARVVSRHETTTEIATNQLNRRFSLEREN